MVRASPHHDHCTCATAVISVSLPCTRLVLEASTKMRYLLDEDLSNEIAVHGRRLGLDIISVTEADRTGIADDEQLAYAADQGRCLVTRNIGDFMALSELFQQRGDPHAGVLLVPWRVRRSEAAAFAAGLSRYDGVHPAGLVPHEVRWLSRNEMLRR